MQVDQLVDNDSKFVKEQSVTHLGLKKGNDQILPVTSNIWWSFVIPYKSCLCLCVCPHLPLWFQKILDFSLCNIHFFFFLQSSCGRSSAMSDASSGFTGPDLPVFLNVTAPTEILLCEETLEMILTVTTILPLSHSLPSPSPKHTSLGVFASSHEQLKRVTTFLWLFVEVHNILNL